MTDATETPPTRESNDNPADGPNAARTMVEKLRELATLEDRNLRRHATAIRAWSSEAAGMIERLSRVAHPDPAKAAPMREDVTRPIVGIENRTAQEVFDIMADRFRLAHTARPDAGDEDVERVGIFLPLDDRAKEAIQNAATFLDSAAGEGIEINGLDAMEVVNALHELLAEDPSQGFHEDVAQWLKGRIEPTVPEDRAAMREGVDPISAPANGEPDPEWAAIKRAIDQFVGRVPSIGKHRALNNAYLAALVERLDAAGDKEAADTIVWQCWWRALDRERERFLLADAEEKLAAAASVPGAA